MCKGGVYVTHALDSCPFFLTEETTQFVNINGHGAHQELLSDMKTQPVDVPASCLASAPSDAHENNA